MWRVKVLGCFAICIAGCGERLPVAPASGTVMLDGKPLAGASITTQPVAVDSRNPGPGSFATTDDQGRFELELVKPAMKGAIIGEHRVLITPETGETMASEVNQADASKPKQWSDTPQTSVGAGDKFPASFSDGSLRIQVTADGVDDLRLELSRAK